MDHFYYTVNLGSERMLCLAPLTERRISMSGQEIEDPSGYFLFEQYGSGDDADIQIIAHVVSEDAALRLRAMLNMD
jgi:hypothetical protein